MPRSKLSFIAAGSMLAGALSFSLPSIEPAQAQDAGAVAAGVVSGIAGAFLFGGRNYCWYDNGWNGPGWYWCGYGYNYGAGWGGPVGWHGWRWRGGHPPGYRPGWRPGPGHGRPGMGGPGGGRPSFGRPGGRPGGGRPGGGRPGGGGGKGGHK
jgi:hypothetical protein